ncbi:hypothetical protein GF325_07310 [Candidatus Bathyarchaeota archaeon]|nr:hypothetical protein [Candidatus Bathyarchaeota archaeon]
MMSMNVHERIIRALDHDEPDRVPTLAQYFEKPFIREVGRTLPPVQRFKWRFTQHLVIEVARVLGFDAVWLHYNKQRVPRGERPEIPSDVTKKFGLGEPNEWGHVSIRGSDGSKWYQDGVLKTPALVQDWISYIKTWEAGAPKVYRHFKSVWVSSIKKGVVPIPTAGAVAWITWSSIGLNRFAWMTRKHLGLVKDLAKAWGEFTRKQHDMLFEQGIDLVFICDDFALKARTIYSPGKWESIIHPVYKMLAKHAHGHGARFLVHGDGNVEDVLPWIVKAGVDAIEPLEYEAGNRLRPLKERFGDDITLIGNVPATQVLTFGSVHDTIEMTKQCIADAARGGGYVLGAGSDILGTCKLDNVRAMVSTVKSHGRY